MGYVPHLRPLWNLELGQGRKLDGGHYLDLTFSVTAPAPAPAPVPEPGSLGLLGSGLLGLGGLIRRKIGR